MGLGGRSTGSSGTPMSKVLGLWMPHPEGGEFMLCEARCDEAGHPIMLLYEEGLGDTCWAWEVDEYPFDAPGSFYQVGSDLDKETARRQADAVAVREGYTFLEDTNA